MCAHKTKPLHNVLQNSKPKDAKTFTGLSPAVTWFYLSYNEFGWLTADKEIWCRNIIVCITACLGFNSECASLCVCVCGSGKQRAVRGRGTECCLKCRRTQGWGNCVWRAMIMMRRRSDQILCLQPPCCLPSLFPFWLIDRCPHPPEPFCYYLLIIHR